MATQLPRVFRLGSMVLEDPCPGGLLDESVRMLSKNFVQFRSYRLYAEDGVVEGDKLVYTMRTPPAKDNG